MMWHDEAACAAEVNAPFAESFFTDTAQDIYRAKRICASCPVRQECYREGLREARLQAREPELRPEDAGIWGGLTGRELADVQGLPCGSPVRLKRDRGIGLLVAGKVTSQVAQAVGVTYETVRDWERAVRAPEVANVSAA